MKRAGGVSIVWEPNGEAAEYAQDFIEALTLTSQCSLGFRSELRAIGREAMGVVLLTRDWDQASQVAIAMRLAFERAHIDHTLRSEVPVGAAADLTILVGSK